MPTAATKPRLLTVADYLAVPEGTRCQLIDGGLVMEPSAPSRFHQEIVGNLHVILRPFVMKRRMGRVYLAPFDVYLSDHDVLQPDLCYFSKARLDRLTDAGAQGAPDLAIEVVSPWTARLEKNRKREIYHRDGVLEYWLIEPNLCQIHVYDFTRDALKPVRLVDEDETFESPLLPGLTIDGREVFAGR